MLKKKRRITQNELLCQLYVRHQLYEELATFKAQRKLPKAEKMTKQQIYLRVQDLISNK